MRSEEWDGRMIIFTRCIQSPSSWMRVRHLAFPLSLRKCPRSKAVYGVWGRHTAGFQSRNLGFSFPFREANMWTGRVNLATLLKESFTAKSLSSCCLWPLAPGVAFPPSADLPLCSCRDIYTPLPARYALHWGHFQRLSILPSCSPVFPACGGCPEHPYWAHHVQHLFPLNWSWGWNVFIFHFVEKKACCDSIPHMGNGDNRCSVCQNGQQIGFEARAVSYSLPGCNWHHNKVQALQ